MEVVQERETMHEVFIHLAIGERETIMDKVADEYATTSPVFPLIVTVYGHGGWYVSYGYESFGVKSVFLGTANNQAVYPASTQEFRRRCYYAHRIFLPEVRR